MGRLDNPSEYDCWYLAAEASGAIGETFGDLDLWISNMFVFPALPGATRALGTYEVDDAIPVLDLDDARNLLALGLRPTQVVERNRAVSQGWALQIYNQLTPTGARRWSGVRWWSYHRPQWRIYGLWGLTPHCVKVELLDLNHPAVVDAAKILAKRRR
jgi:hypothetical protein